MKGPLVSRCFRLLAAGFLAAGGAEADVMTVTRTYPATVPPAVPLVSGATFDHGHDLRFNVSFDYTGLLGIQFYATLFLNGNTTDANHGIYLVRREFLEATPSQAFVIENVPVGTHLLRLVASDSASVPYEQKDLAFTVNPQPLGFESFTVSDTTPSDPANFEQDGVIAVDANLVVRNTSTLPQGPLRVQLYQRETQYQVEENSNNNEAVAGETIGTPIELGTIGAGSTMNVGLTAAECPSYTGGEENGGSQGMLLAVLELEGPAGVWKSVDVLLVYASPIPVIYPPDGEQTGTNANSNRTPSLADGFISSIEVEGPDPVAGGSSVQYTFATVAQSTARMSGYTNATWGTTAGSISPSGLLTAPASAGPLTVTANYDYSGQTHSDDLLVTVTEPAFSFATWIGGFGLPAGEEDPEDNPDLDLFNNLLEFVFGTNPGLPDPVGPLQPWQGADGTIGLEIRRLRDLGDVTLYLDSSPSMRNGTWTNRLYTVEDPYLEYDIVPGADPPVDRVRLKSQDSFADTTLFWRLRAELATP